MVFYKLVAYKTTVYKQQNAGLRFKYAIFSRQQIDVDMRKRSVDKYLFCVVNYTLILIKRGVPSRRESSETVWKLSRFAFLPAACHPTCPLPESDHRLSGALFHSRHSPTFSRYVPSHNWIGSFLEAAAAVRLSKSPSASQKRICASALSVL